MIDEALELLAHLHHNFPGIDRWLMKNVPADSEHDVMTHHIDHQNQTSTLYLLSLACSDCHKCRSSASLKVNRVPVMLYLGLRCLLVFCRFQVSGVQTHRRNGALLTSRSRPLGSVIASSGPTAGPEGRPRLEALAAHEGSVLVGCGSFAKTTPRLASPCERLWHSVQDSSTRQEGI